MRQGSAGRVPAAPHAIWITMIPVDFLFGRGQTYGLSSPPQSGNGFSSRIPSLFRPQKGVLMATRRFAVGSLTLRHATAVLGAFVLSVFLAGTFARLASAGPGEEENAAERKSEKSGDSPDRKAQMEAMRRLAAGIKVTITDDKE